MIAEIIVNGIKIAPPKKSFSNKKYMVSPIKKTDKCMRKDQFYFCKFPLYITDLQFNFIKKCAISFHHVCLIQCKSNPKILTIDDRNFLEDDNGFFARKFAFKLVTKTDFVFLYKVYRLE